MNLLEKFQEQKDNFKNFAESTQNFTSNIGAFQKNTLIIATGILILLLVIVGILMLNSKKQDFPQFIKRQQRTATLTMYQLVLAESDTPIAQCETNLLLNL